MQHGGCGSGALVGQTSTGVTASQGSGIGRPYVGHGDRDTMYLREVHFMASTMVHIRIDQKTKQRAAKTLAAMGMSVSDAVRMMLLRVAAEKALPFEVKVPNATTAKAMRAADRGEGRRLNSAGLFKDLGI